MDEEQCETTEIIKKPAQKKVSIEITVIDSTHYLVRIGYHQPLKVFHGLDDMLKAIKKEIHSLNN